MASKLQNSLDFAEETECKVDMAPMIDMVFLLLIFFFVTANFIDQRLNRNVQVPVASQTKSLDKVGERILIHIMADGNFMGDHENMLSLLDVENLCRAEAEAARSKGKKPILMVRGDRRSTLKEMKRVVGAAANAGVIDVSFSTQKSDFYKNSP